MQKTALIHKHIGETPLEALERFRREQVEKVDAGLAENVHNAGQKISNESFEWKTVPMTYAGRLDPMAEGELLILIGEECKNKEKYLGLDKEYEVEIVFGIETDTYDALGLAQATREQSERSSPHRRATREQSERSRSHRTVGPAQDLDTLDLQEYVGKFTQEYPPYSSKTVDGVQLHELARTDTLPEIMPQREVEIYEIEEQEVFEISGLDLLATIIERVDRVSGDFRQDEIRQRWYEVLDDGVSSGQKFGIMKIRVKCSSGTYMRSLAHRIGRDMGCGAFALSIKRTKIFGLMGLTGQ